MKMKTDEFVLKWKRQNCCFKKQIKREDAMASFEGLGFSNNNEVLKRLTEIIPYAIEIKIDWDNTAEVNQLYYTIDKEEKGIPIINKHSIVWEVWKGYCIDGEEIKKR